MLAVSPPSELDQDESQLVRILSIRDELTAELSGYPDTVRGFLNDRRALIARVRTERKRRARHPLAHTTCTAFCLYYLLEAGLVDGIGRSPELPALLTRDEVYVLTRALGNAIYAGHRNGRRRPLVTDIRALPNQYNTPIQLAGYFRACAALRIQPRPSVLNATMRGLRWLLRE